MRYSLIPSAVYDDYSAITPELLKAKHIRLLLCDLDYTLAPRSVPRPDEKLNLWIQALKSSGITVMILSNNRSSKRVDLFCHDLGIRYVGHAQKPSKKGFLEAMNLAGVTPEETAMLGDKLLTDMLGANVSGVLALMVEPLGGPVGAWNKVLHAMQVPFKRKAGKR